ncbi:MAG: twitching motility protein [Clostridia bacterium]|nr:twitching motility protein [Clostridia bacterium]
MMKEEILLKKKVKLTFHFQYPEQDDFVQMHILNTGSGKSTTLASMLNAINATRSCHIITIEDPIEYLHKHNMSLIEQREVGTDTGSFASALRAALREDPDVILVGEMRDPETISIALSAAETGHLVFSTLHTVGAAKTVDRIVDSFIAEQQAQVRGQLATVLEGVVSQTLIPKKEGKGRVVACEIMLCNSAVRNLIREGKQFQINSIIQTNSNIGMQLLDARLAELCAQNVISKEEALLRASDQQVFSQLLTSYRSKEGSQYTFNK